MLTFDLLNLRSLAPISSPWSGMGDEEEPEEEVEAMDSSLLPPG